jgi:hypothetical protein
LSNERRCRSVVGFSFFAFFILASSFKKQEEEYETNEK